MLTTLDPEVQSMLLDDSRLHDLLARLTARKRKTAKLKDIWSAFASVYDDLPSGRERRLWLLTVLEELDASAEIALPVSHGRQWDRTSDIVLPTKVSLCSSEQSEEKTNWRTFAWHPALQWVLDRRHVIPGHFQFLKKVHQGLVEGWFEASEPLKYRSLQLTGDEKRLQKLCKCRLFGPGRLTLAMLGCKAEVLPLAIERFCGNSTMLLFENAAPFMVARGILKEMDNTGIGCLGYGAGKQVIKSVGYLSMIEPPVERVLYVGDLDAAGIQLAADIERLSRHVTILPATSFHRAMIDAAAELGSANGWPVKEKQPRQVAEFVLGFVDDSVRSECAQLISSGRRIPEEVVSRATMRRILSRDVRKLHRTRN